MRFFIILPSGTRVYSSSMQILIKYPVLMEAHFR